MSVTKNQVIITWKFIEDYLRCPSFCRNSVPLTSTQSKIWRDAVGLCALAWMDLTASNHMPLPRWLPRWLKEISETDVIDVVKSLKLADELLVTSVSSFSNYDTFKQYLKGRQVSMGILSPLKWLIDQWYLYRDPTTFSRIHTAFTFITRVNLPDLDDLGEAALESYLLNESRLESLSEFSDEETSIITSWFPYVNLSHLLDGWIPQHGPGGVADVKGTCRLDKYNSSSSDDMIRRLDFILGGNTQHHVSKRLDRCAKLVFVPKSIDKLRTISMEPVSLQWYQQGFMRSILNEVKIISSLSRRINLEDQSISRELCYLGSIDGKLSTIDLSDASDSVSIDLIKKWFRRSSLLPICIMTRSREVMLPTGERLALKKFAPMGSALCFPIECIVFSAIVEASIRECGGSVRESSYRVYGDDIIVETQYASTVLNRLVKNGFKVNTSKSFFIRDTHNYRESCGAEFLDGVDVTPVRLPRKFLGLPDVRHSINSSSIEDTIALCNIFYMMLPSVRRVLIKELLKLPKHLRPVFDNSGEFGIFSPNPTNYHLQSPRYREDIQSYWIRHGASRSRGKHDHVDESIALYDTLNVIGRRSKDYHPDNPYFSSMTRKPFNVWSLTKTNIEVLTTREDDKVSLQRGVKK